MLYGKSATDAALASQGDEGDHPHSPTGRKFERIPELTREFFESAFFRRFHIAREYNSLQQMGVLTGRSHHGHSGVCY